MKHSASSLHPLPSDDRTGPGTIPDIPKRDPIPSGKRRRLLRRTAAAILPSSVLVRRGPRLTRKIALTFDDGPLPLLSQYLDVLDDHGAYATFFVVGEEAAPRRDALLELVSRGHEVANHGYTHKKFTDMTRVELDDELACTSLVLPVGHARRPLVRPPGGHTSVRSLARTAYLGYLTVLWSHDSADARTRDPKVVARNVSARAVSPGDIVLLHEGQPWTLEALPTILSGLRAAGYELVTVSNLLGL